MPHLPPSSESRELAQSLYRRKDYQLALEHANKAINAEKQPSLSSLDIRAAVFEKILDHQSALKDARTIIKLYGNDATGYLRAGKVLQKMDKPDVALQIYERGISKKPQQLELLIRMRDRLLPLIRTHKAADPFSQLPLELVQQILSYLSFRQVACVNFAQPST